MRELSFTNVTISKKALEMLNRIYSLFTLYANFFQPSMKLKGKHRHRAKVDRTYVEAQIPCNRLLKSGIFSQREKRDLMDAFQNLSPVMLLKK